MHVMTMYVYVTSHTYDTHIVHKIHLHIHMYVTQLFALQTSLLLIKIPKRLIELSMSWRRIKPYIIISDSHRINCN